LKGLFNTNDAGVAAGRGEDCVQLGNARTAIRAGPERGADLDDRGQPPLDNGPMQVFQADGKAGAHRSVGILAGDADNASQEVSAHFQHNRRPRAVLATRSPMAMRG